MRRTVWVFTGVLALIGCGSITPLVTTSDDASTPATTFPDAAAMAPPVPDAPPPDAGPGLKAGKGDDKGDNGMGDDASGKGKD
jgi:hypothetical protein